MPSLQSSPFQNASSAPYPFIISGLKAAQPGNLNSTGANTLKPAQTAKPVNQTATGNTSGSYQGVPINSSGNVAQQIAAINMQKYGTSSTPSLGATGTASAPNPSYTNALNPTNTNQSTAGQVPTSYTTPSGATVNAGTGQVTNIGTPAQSAINNGSAAYANTANGTPSGVGYVGQAANTAQGNLALGQNAQNIGNQYAPLISNALNNSALAVNSLETGGGPSAVLQGNALAQAQLGASRAQGYGTAEQAALQGNQQQLTAQNQATQGLQAAGNSLLPTSAGFPFSFNPATGQYSTPSGGTSGSTGSSPTLTYNPQQDASNLATAVIQGKVPYTNAVQSMGYAGQVGQGLLTSAITAQGGNLTQIQAQQAATQSNIQTSGTAATNAAAANVNTEATAGTSSYATGLNNSIQSYNNVKLQAQNVNALGNLTVSVGNQGNINPFAAVPANTTLQSFLGQLSSPEQIKFNSAMASFQAAAGSLLAQADGSLPTTVSSQISKIADGSISMGALQSLVEQATSEGAIKQGDQASQVVNYQSQLAGKQAPNLPGTMTANGTTYVLNDNGTYDAI